MTEPKDLYLVVCHDHPVREPPLAEGRLLWSQPAVHYSVWATTSPLDVALLGQHGIVSVHTNFIAAQAEVLAGIKEGI